MSVIVSLTENRYLPSGTGVPFAMAFAGAAMVNPIAATATSDPSSVAMDRLRRTDKAPHARERMNRPTLTAAGAPGCPVRCRGVAGAGGGGRGARGLPGVGGSPLPHRP